MSEAQQPAIWRRVLDLFIERPYEWWSPIEICDELGIHHATAITARIRDIRQKTNHDVECRIIEGVYRYRLVPALDEVA